MKPLIVRDLAEMLTALTELHGGCEVILSLDGDLSGDSDVRMSDALYVGEGAVRFVGVGDETEH